MKNLNPKPVPSAEYSVEELEINYRSLKKILEFNDKVFKEIAAKSDAYRDAGARSG
jgi:ATP-dependent exoDNAse (exonuclease V) beta subunit